MQFFFYNLSYIILIFSVLMVILLNNPIYCILYFLFYFLNVVILLLSVGLEFIGLLYLIIYVGAITVLFLFVVMMLNLKTIEWNLYLYKFLPVGSFFSSVLLFEFFFSLKDFLVNPIDPMYNIFFLDWLKLSFSADFFFLLHLFYIHFMDIL